jgi:ubiquinone/menaquinone biosynthesis C-methylase UbiE
MNYDLTEIPSGYDKARDHGPEFLRRWMRALEVHIGHRRVGRMLDLGCGTGRFSDALSVHFSVEVVGVDPSVRMLDQARSKPVRGQVRYQLGSGEAIPLSPESVDVVFMSMAFHHLDDRWLAARECRRVLRPEGVVCIRTGIRERIDSYPYVPFFPSTRPKLLGLLPDRFGIREPFEEAGFSMKASEVILQTIAHDWEAYAEKLAAGGDSVLATLSKEEFAAGLAALRQYGQNSGAQGIVEPIDLFVFS